MSAGSPRHEVSDVAPRNPLVPPRDELTSDETEAGGNDPDTQTEPVMASAKSAEPTIPENSRRSNDSLAPGPESASVSFNMLASPFARSATNNDIIALNFSQKTPRFVTVASRRSLLCDGGSSPIINVAEQQCPPKAAVESDSDDGNDTLSRSPSSNTTNAAKASQNRFEDSVTQRKGCISFSVLVVLLMLVPVAFLLFYSIINFVAASRTMVFERQHHDLMIQLGECEEGLMLERGRTSVMIAGNNSKRWMALREARLLTDAHCDTALHAAISSPNEEISQEFTARMRQGSNSVAIARHLVDNFGISTEELRKVFTQQILQMDVARSLVASNKAMRSQALFLMELKLMRLTANYFGLCRACGGEMLARLSTDNDTTSVLEELTNYNMMFTFLTGQLRTIAQTRGNDYLNMIDTDLRTQLAIAMMNRLLENPRDQPGFTADEYFEGFTVAINSQHGVDLLFLKDIQESARIAMVIESVKLVLALFGCTIATALIVQSNLRTQKRIDFAVARSRQMQQAIQKFVPRSFLKLCKCTSITHVQAGDQTQVATSMLFCDIRNFTSVSETMTNEHLFLWLQQYFKRMTSITEFNHGFVDKLIGDSIFAVFDGAADAVQCGIDMQTSVGKLNLDFVGSQGTTIIGIGVGIHHAVVSAGFLGDDTRLTVTLISCEVNMASRLEGLTKRYGARILLSQRAADQIGNANKFESRRLGDVQVKGSNNPFGIVEVFQADEITLKRCKLSTKGYFEEAVDLRSQGQLEQSNELFQRCHSAAIQFGVHDGAAALKLSTKTACDVFEEK